MRLGTLATIAIGAAAGYLGARALMEREALPERLPAPLRDPLERAGARLRRASEEAQMLLDELEQVRHAIEQELTDDYLRRVGRSSAEAHHGDEDEPAESAAPAPSAPPSETPLHDRV